MVLYSDDKSVLKDELKRLLVGMTGIDQFCVYEKGQDGQFRCENTQLDAALILKLENSKEGFINENQVC